jgi:chemotaxis-related protein WspB
MLLLVFRLGDDRCALDAGRIVEVLPLLPIEHVVGAPPEISGGFGYRGRFVPAVDLSQRLLGRPAGHHLSTRLVLVTIAGDDGPCLLGLVLEKATSTIRCDPDELIPPAVASSDHPWLGALLPDTAGPIRVVDVDRLVADDVRPLLSPTRVAVA